MKRFFGLVLACAMLLSLAAIAAAQTPQPVVRMGDWVEIGNEAFMNVIGTIDTRYRTVNNADWDNDVQDTPLSSDNNSSVAYSGTGDYLEAEVRWGADFRYQKNMRMRILFETQTIFDGNIIDSADDNNGAPHVERYWIDYKFTGTPLRVRVGADLWALDPGRVVADDDPRFAIYLTPTPNLDLHVAAVMQRESNRNGLTNDNDDVYYTFGAHYSMKPHQIGLDLAYFRTRWARTCEQNYVDCNFLRTNNVIIMPSYTGVIGPATILFQPMVVAGSADGFNGENYNIFSWGILARAEFDLGMVHPFIDFIYGRGDDDATDSDLNGFANVPWADVTLNSFPELNYSPLSNIYLHSPANSLVGGNGSQIFLHSTGNPWNHRAGNTAHSGTNTAYSNPGTLKVPVGVFIFPVKGHRITLRYTYVGITHDATLVAQSVEFQGNGVDNAISSVSKTLYHDLTGWWDWTLNPHLDFRLGGWVMIPGSGVKDIAASMDCNGSPCSGDTVSLGAEMRIRGRF